MSSSLGCAAVLALAIIALPGASSALAKEEISIHVLDVGEGLSVLIESPRGDSVLVDTGNPMSVGVINTFLKKRDIHAISHLILTHPHLDHVGGFFGLNAMFPISTLWDNGQDVTAEASADDMYRWFDEQRRAHPRSRRARRGVEIVDQPFQLRVLSPHDGVLDEDWNKNSVVLELRYGTFRALFMGDATVDTESDLLRGGTLDAVSVLQVGHHGSRFASSAPFIGALRPKLSVISTNEKNLRGYPAAEVVERLRFHGTVLVTFEQGTISIAAKRDGTFAWSSPRAD